VASITLIELSPPLTTMAAALAGERDPHASCAGDARVDPFEVLADDAPMKPALRKLVLTFHVTTSVGWLGAVVAYLIVAITGLTSAEDELARAAYLTMNVIGWFVIVPFSVAAMLTGLVQSLGTEWGLFRHYWIFVKFVLAAIGTVVLFGHMRAVTHASGLAMENTILGADHATLRTQMVVHAAGGLVILLVATVLSIYKPWGKTRYGRRRAA
jgi:predicted secreted protein